MNYKSFAVAATLAATAITAPASAQVFTGDTDGEATWNRPVATAVLSGVGTDVEFQATQFTIDVVGDYVFDLSAIFDTVLVLYEGSFDPNNQFANQIAYNDDGGPGSDSNFTANLTTGVSYFAVATGFDNDDSGAYSLTIAGPGTATGAGAVPEPATWAFMIFGFGAVGGALRSRRKQTTRVSFA